MNDTLIIKDSKALLPRLILAGVIIVALIFLFFSVKWLVANLFAELTSVSDPQAAAVADLATGLSPGDPFALWLKTKIARDEFSMDSVDRATTLTEGIVRLSPNDFRWWVELGRAYEQSEQPVRAEAALKQAVTLAPEYTFPRWQLGNFLLRRGRTEEAFAELKRATEKSSVYREQVFALAWDYFDKDPARVEMLAGEAPDMRASLAMFYAVRGAAPDALRNWNLLSPEQQEENKKLLPIMAQGLFDKLELRESLEFAKAAGIDADANIGAVTNAGFEKLLGHPDDTLFGWNIYRGDGRIEISADSNVKREGNRSIRTNFKGYLKPELHNIVQVIALESGASYRMSVWLRTENLRSGGMPVMQILNMKDNSLLATTQPFAAGTNDWTQLTLDFKVPEDSSGVSVRTARVYCPGECPLVGTMWYDEIVLTKL